MIAAERLCLIRWYGQIIHDNTIPQNIAEMQKLGHRMLELLIQAKP